MNQFGNLEKSAKQSLDIAWTTLPRIFLCRPYKFVLWVNRKLEKKKTNELLNIPILKMFFLDINQCVSRKI